MADDDGGGAPAWMISFGDMMTLILTFFILLVSMSKTQEVGLVARGVGSFIVAVRSFGLPGILSEPERAAYFENVRMRFNLPPEEDPERRPEDHTDASNLELIRARAANALQPHDEIGQPAIAVYEPGSSELTPAARRYIDLLASTLRPAPHQLLLLEGHAPTDVPDPRRLAHARAQSVRRYLIEEHSFPPTRIEARAWYSELSTENGALDTVDARLILPLNHE